MANTQPLGTQWKGRAWDDGSPIPRVTLPDGTLGEAMAALGYIWDATDQVFIKATANHADGGINVHLVGNDATSTITGTVTANQGTGGNSAWKVDGSAVTQPVSLATVPTHGVTVTDGADTNAGATTDTAVITDTTGTVSGKLRGLVKWAYERMPASLGQKTMAGSLPVTVASDQPALTTNATLSAETTKVIGTVNQGTSPWLTSRNWTLSSGTDSATVTVATDSVGLAKDASLTTIFGTPTSDSPGAYTVLDQLSRIRKTNEQNTKALQALLAVMTPAPPRKTQTTLLHRS